MINQAIILAGGLGTRLRSVVSDRPKCLASVAGQPFLYYLIDYLCNNGIEHFIFSLGYQHEMIEAYLKTQEKHLSYTVIIESEPLGTGGAILKACQGITGNPVLVCNGDTLFAIDLVALNRFHEQNDPLCTLCLKPMHQSERYGMVSLNQDQSVKAFREKQFFTSGLINGGVYALNAGRFVKEELPEKFSFENDFLRKFVTPSQQETKSALYGIIQDRYFIDIGIPEDYKRAQSELKHLQKVNFKNSN